jgi:hypothetical protein
MMAQEFEFLKTAYIRFVTGAVYIEYDYRLYEIRTGEDWGIEGAKENAASYHQRSQDPVSCLFTAE